MPTAGIILLVYFIGGLLALLAFDLATGGRMRTNIPMAGTQAQIRMTEANSPIGPRAGIILMLTITWLFWPLVLIGSLTGKEEQNGRPTVTRRADVIGAGARAKVSYLVRKIWYGECPDCHVVLTPMDIWGRYSTCPVCKTEFHGFRMKARKRTTDGNKE